MSSKYEVVVGNIGTVHQGNSRKFASEVFEYYIRLSKSGVGRVAGEDVSLTCNDRPTKEYIPNLGAEQ